MKINIITIQGEVHSSKNSRRIMRGRNGSPFISKSKRSKEDEGIFAVQLYNQRGAWEGMTRDVPFPLTVIFFFRRATHRAFDYVNIAQGILDAMVKAEYLPDDSADYVIPSFLPYVVDKENPGCDISISPLRIVMESESVQPAAFEILDNALAEIAEQRKEIRKLRGY